jgi:hypothetical protein
MGVFCYAEKEGGDNGNRKTVGSIKKTDSLASSGKRPLGGGCQRTKKKTGKCYQRVHENPPRKSYF